MKLRQFTALIVCVGAVMGVLFLSEPAEATLKYKKETGKKCSFCHVSIPEQGDEDPKLTEDGKKFKENGNRLTPEQQQKPD